MAERVFCFQLFFWHILPKIDACHLTIDAEEGGEVAVGGGGVGGSDAPLPGQQGDGSVVEVTIDAAEGIVGAQSVVGCAVAVVVLHHLQQGGVGGEGDVVAVLLQGGVQRRPHPVGTALAAMHAEDDEKADSHEGEDDEKSLSSHNSAAKVHKFHDFTIYYLFFFKKRGKKGYLMDNG